ncbi:MAG TPA: hypothetical protein VEL73_05430 [Mycobacteriales bacterium]|nr:hypothetical protein [Mycobacteriales bacterium]
MTWTWRYQDTEGQPLPDPPAGQAPPAPSFGTKGDAESWLGETWRDLLDAGVQQVALVEDGRVEYAMPLTPAEDG